MKTRNSTKKAVYITGGTSGLGLCLVRKFLEMDYLVYVTGRNEEKLSELHKNFNSQNLVTISCDITNIVDIKKSFENIDFLNVLVNNAGIWLEGELLDATDEKIISTIQTNLTGLILTTKYAIPKLQKAITVSTVVNISSTAGIEPRSKNSVYAATKFAIKGFTDCMNMDYRNGNIRFVGVYPGGMKTDLFKSAGVEKNLENYMDPDEVADVIIKAIQKPDNMVIDTIIIRRTKYS